MAAVALLAACRTPQPDVIVVSERAWGIRDVQLAGGAIRLQVVVPLSPPGPKPAVIGLPALRDPLLPLGVVWIAYRVDWERLGGPPAAPEADDAGQLVLASPSADVLGERYLHRIALTAHQVIPQILDYLDTLADVDPERIMIAGEATDGFVALQAVARDERLAGAIVVGACGDYHGFLAGSALGMSGAPLALDRGYDEWIRTQEVVQHPARVVPAALLLVHRTGDDVVPVACADTTARALADAYDAAGAAERFRYVRRDAAGRGTGDGERDAALEWVRRWLVS